MKYLLACFCCCFVFVTAAQKVELPAAKFINNDNSAYSAPAFDDSKWVELKTTTNWDNQGFGTYDGFGWYRIHVVMPHFFNTGNPVRLYLGRADDACEVYFNGTLIGKSGAFPSDKGGYVTTWDKGLEFHLESNNPLIKWDADNVISVRVYDGNGLGGLFGPMPYINVMDLIDGIKISPDPVAATKRKVLFTNTFASTISGKCIIESIDEEGQSVISTSTTEISLAKGQVKQFDIPAVKANSHSSYAFTFIENTTKKSVSVKQYLPYILTPKPGDAPQINAAKVYGVRPNSPFIFKIPATGKKPLQYSVDNLPEGFKVNALNGVITGKLKRSGDYKVTLVVKNKSGVAKKEFTIKCGDVLALTPPMGWNSWNCWGLSVSDERLKASAKAMMDKGLIDHGWAYMNIDDGWEAAVRNANGEIAANKKFPDMKKLGDWLHGNGLKFGIYSSPGTTTCGDYLGSYQHEMQDATTYASWGIDYLKYDWCSYGDIHDKNDNSLESYKKPYEVMQAALQKQNRDIVYSLCQYGMKDVWQWGETVNGNCWRTTGDITDTWQSLSSIGFSQTKQYPYAKPGRWNDPDMMIVGQVGWGDYLHNTRLTPDEQYTHVSLWSLLSAPLLIGCDLSKLDDFTLNLLTNDEVIAVNQDVLGRQAKQILIRSNPNEGDYQVWVKELEGGSQAIGIFNTSDKSEVVRFHWNELYLLPKQQVRDLWRQKDLGNFDGMFSTRVPAHGVTLIKVTAN
ncbi:putative Ig domain-containing protein [Ferruginibacter profundus]